MSRRIITSQLHAAGATVPIDGYFDKLLKYIPADINAGWVAVTGLLAGLAKPNNTLLWVLFFVFIVLTAAWTYKQTQQQGLPSATKQIIISTLAFVVWIFALGGPFALMGWYNPVFGAILLVIYTLVVPLINPD
jgi:hypothetical protein